MIQSYRGHWPYLLNIYVVNKLIIFFSLDSYIKYGENISICTSQYLLGKQNTNILKIESRKSEKTLGNNWKITQKTPTIANKLFFNLCQITRNNMQNNAKFSYAFYRNRFFIKSLHVYSHFRYELLLMQYLTCILSLCKW